MHIGSPSVTCVPHIPAQAEIVYVSVYVIPFALFTWLLGVVAAAPIIKQVIQLPNQNRGSGSALDYWNVQSKSIFMLCGRLGTTANTCVA